MPRWIPLPPFLFLLHLLLLLFLLLLLPFLSCTTPSMAVIACGRPYRTHPSLWLSLPSTLPPCHSPLCSVPSTHATLGFHVALCRCRLLAFPSLRLPPLGRLEWCPETTMEASNVGCYDAAIHKDGECQIRFGVSGAGISNLVPIEHCTPRIVRFKLLPPPPSPLPPPPPSLRAIMI